MAISPNKLSQLWEELKRRNVIHVITVYAASAFVILELVDIITEPFGLPTWTLKLVVVVLVSGLLVAIILSWIYDIHPKGGLVKTESADKVKAGDTHKSSNGWKIASYISFVVIVGLIVLNIIPRTAREYVSETYDKSIAVLPFRNDSPDQERMYFINGTMESILDNLCKIEDLRVPGRTSVEQYRINPKPIPVVAEEMNVSYVLEGSGHRDGNHVRLFVQLLDGRKDQHIWSRSYDADIEEIFSLQSEIAQMIASEIQAIITPEEKKLIENQPTKSLTALDYYQQAREDHWKYWLHNDSVALQRAEELYLKALKADTSYAQAYNGLAQVYEVKHGSEEYLTESYLDSVLMLTDIALSYNRYISETHIIRGNYYANRNNSEMAISEFNKALQLNPNDWYAYNSRANLYRNIDFLCTIENRHKAVELNRGQGLSTLLRQLSADYSLIGFPDQARVYAQQYLDLTGDSSVIIPMIYSDGSFVSENRIDMLKKVYHLDSTNGEIVFRIGETYSFLGNQKEALKYFEKCFDLDVFLLNRFHRIAYAYWNIGEKDKAEYYFKRQVEYGTGEISLGRRQAAAYFSYYDLAGTYAFRGDKTKAYDKLRMFAQKENMPQWILDYMYVDPLFDNIRDEPEFQQIVRDVEAKYQAEHERVRQWLEENEML
jgi:TolB-like protein/Tfp pilus assembly protein PilF